jgi:hypothetical protein
MVLLVLAVGLPVLLMLLDVVMRKLIFGACDAWTGFKRLECICESVPELMATAAVPLCPVKPLIVGCRDQCRQAPLVLHIARWVNRRCMAAVLAIPATVFITLCVERGGDVSFCAGCFVLTLIVFLTFALAARVIVDGFGREVMQGRLRIVTPWLEENEIPAAPGFILKGSELWLRLLNIVVMTLLVLAVEKVLDLKESVALVFSMLFVGVSLTVLLSLARGSGERKKEPPPVN